MSQPQRVWPDLDVCTMDKKEEYEISVKDEKGNQNHIEKIELHFCSSLSSKVDSKQKEVLIIKESQHTL